MYRVSGPIRVTRIYGGRFSFFFPSFFRLGHRREIFEFLHPALASFWGYMFVGLFFLYLL